MNKIILLLLLPVVGHAQGGKELKIKGKLKTSNQIEWVYINYRNGDESVSDSVQVKGGNFTYKGKLSEPALGSISFRGRNPFLLNGKNAAKYTRPVFLEQGTIKVRATDSIQGLVITGSKAHQDYLALQEAQKAHNAEMNKLYASYSEISAKKDKAALKELEKKVDSVDAVIKETVFLPFVRNNPNSPAALYAIKQYAGYEIDADKVEPLFNSLPASSRQWPSAVIFSERIDIAKKTGIGKYAMDFVQADTAGIPVSLSSFRGKYVLVDFWASWCGPCRQENPNLVKVFNQYKDRGFTVLGVSLDRPTAKDRWLKAIKDDGLAWTQLSDLKFWDNAVAKQYGIQAIPQNLLLDPEGKIIAKNLRGEDLEAKMAEIFTAKTF